MRRFFILILIHYPLLTISQDTIQAPPPPDFSFGINLIGSIPSGDFSSSDLTNPDAGFANGGFGAGVFAHFLFKSGFFVEIDADCVFRSSSALDGAVEILNDNDQQIDYSVNENPNYRHFAFSFGPGFQFGPEQFQGFVRARVGITHSSMSKSSVLAEPGGMTNFQNSGEAMGAYGLGVGILLGNRLRFEVNYQNLGTPTFQFVKFNEETEFSLPIQVLEIKLGIELTHNKTGGSAMIKTRSLGN